MNYAQARRARDAQSEAEYRANWRATRRTLAEYLHYVISERLVESTGVPIYATPDTVHALRSLGLDSRRYGIEINRRADAGSVDQLLRDLERIYRGRPHRRRDRGVPSTTASRTRVRDRRRSTQGGY